MTTNPAALIQQRLRRFATTAYKSKRAANAHRLLPLDQSEELFGVDAGAEAPQFLELIAALAAGERDGALPDDTGLIVVATIRTDRYALLQTAEPLPKCRPWCSTNSSGGIDIIRGLRETEAAFTRTVGPEVWLGLS